MIERGSDIPDGTLLCCDVCVIGAGAAGIALALELERLGRSVLLLEAGGTNAPGAAQALYRGEVNDPDRHLPLDHARCRRLGGTTALWGGRCIPYDAIDFEPRSWVAHSGWPVTADEMNTWYARAHRYLACGAFDYRSSSALPGAPGAMIPGFRGESIDTGSIERWSPPIRFGKAYRRALAASASIRVVTAAAAVTLSTDATGALIESVEVKRTGGSARSRGRGFRVSARDVVLAGGGLETARLLMTSRQGGRPGIGAASGWLGRGYMSHIHGVIARVRFRTATPVVSAYEQDVDGVYVRRRLQVSDGAQRALELLNMHWLLDRPLLEDPAHGSAVLSAAFIARRLFARTPAALSAGSKFGLYWGHLRNVLAGSPEVLSVLPGFARSRFLQSRRVPSLLPGPQDGEYHLYFQAEQVPDRSAGLRLSEARDALGQPRLCLDFRVQPQDIDAVRRAHLLLDGELRSQGVGEVRLEPDATERLAAAKAVLGHHLGTTRMAANPACGVVNAHCRVHGVHNLHVASASVFPTSSQANPTLTVVALALRLAHHLGSVPASLRPPSAARVTGEMAWHL